MSILRYCRLSLNICTRETTIPNCCIIRERTHGNLRMMEMTAKPHSIILPQSRLSWKTLSSSMLLSMLLSLIKLATNVLTVARPSDTISKILNAWLSESKDCDKACRFLPFSPQLVGHTNIRPTATRSFELSTWHSSSEAATISRRAALWKSRWNKEALCFSIYLWLCAIILWVLYFHLRILENHLHVSFRYWCCEGRP